MRDVHVAAVCLLLLVAACGEPDASGVYVAKINNGVTLVQLIEDKDHKLSGRVQVTSIGNDGNVTEKSAPLNGSVSENQLVLQPQSVWLGGLQASGVFTSNDLKLTGQGFTLTAQKSSLDDYQDAVNALKTDASGRREKIAQANAQQAQQNAVLATGQAQARTIGSIRQAAEAIASLNTRLNDGLNKAPDFGAMATSNTARIGRMLQAAPSMSDVQRGQLGVAANQVIVGTNQIDVAREQYANQLNGLVEDAKTAALPIAKTCRQHPPEAFTAVCGIAFRAMNAIKATIQRGQANFSPYKAKVAGEIQRQEQLAKQIDG